MGIFVRFFPKKKGYTAPITIDVHTYISMHL